MASEINPIVVPIQVNRIYAGCTRCEDGVYEYMREPSNIKWSDFPHECNMCGHSVRLQDQYPLLSFEEVEPKDES